MMTTSNDDDDVEHYAEVCEGCDMEGDKIDREMKIYCNSTLQDLSS